MRAKSSLLILSIIFFSSVLSASLLLFYLDPESNFTVAFSTMGTAILLGIASGVAMLLYIFKKIYYRGEAMHTVVPSSVRQGTLIALAAVGIGALNAFSLLNYRTGGLFLFILLLFELMIASVTKE